MKKFTRVAMVAATTAAFTVGTTVPALALKTEDWSRTVKCDGTWREYTKAVRYLTGYSDAQLYVTKAAWTDGTFGNTYSMTFRVSLRNSSGTVVARKTDWVESANRWATFDTSNYLPKTRFTLGAKMTDASGTCHNAWAGTLHY